MQNTQEQISILQANLTKRFFGLGLSEEDMKHINKYISEAKLATLQNLHDNRDEMYKFFQVLYNIKSSGAQI